MAPSGVTVLIVVTGSSTLSYAVCFPTLALFLAEVNGTLTDAGSGGSVAASTSTTLGWAVGVYSAAKVLTAPLTGCMVHRIGVRWSLLLLSVLLIVGNILYALARSSAIIIVARVVIGIASTSSTPCRAYVAAGGHPKDVKAGLNAWVGAASTFGFIVGPAIGGLLGLLPSHGLLSRYRAAGWLGCVLGCASAISVLFSPSMDRHADEPLLQSIDTEPPPRTSTAVSRSPSNKSLTESVADGFSIASDALLPDISGIPTTADLQEPAMPSECAVRNGSLLREDSVDASPRKSRSWHALLAICFVQLAVTFPFAAIETLITPLATDAYSWSPVAIGALFAAASAASLPVGMLTPRLLKRASSRAVLMGATLLAAGCVFTMAADAFEPLLAVGMVGFTCAYAASQTALFTLFGELYGFHSSCAQFVGYISSSASVGRFAGPVVANAAYIAAIDAGAIASDASAYTWGGNAAVVLALGAGSLMLSWRLLR